MILDCKTSPSQYVILFNGPKGEVWLLLLLLLFLLGNENILII